jgi:hypothetical protein
MKNKIQRILSEEQVMLESIKAIGRQDGSPFGNLFPAEKPIVR